jgi:hypothetical protein
MDVHKEFALNVFGRKTTEADNLMSLFLDTSSDADLLNLIEYHACWLIDAKQTHNCSEQRQKPHNLVVGHR